MKICSVPGCNNKHKAKGYCGRHIQQIYTYGKIISESRSKLDPNEIIIENNIAKMKLYDKNGNIISETIFDSQFTNEISKYKWSLVSYGYVGGTWFDKVNNKNKHMLLHRFIIYLSDQITNDNYWEVDHADGNKLNNLLSNLRKCSSQQNNRNSTKNPNRFFSKYKGVTKHQDGFRVSIYVNKKGIYIGYFKDEIEAAKAYNLAALKHFGEFAKLNIV